MKKALLFGSTGLTGSYLLKELQNSEYYSEIVVFSRRAIDVEHQKVRVEIIDFEKLNDFKNLVTGDDLFCCLGTTMKNAGSQKATRKVDYDYPVEIANIAAQNKVKSFLVVSAVMANASSGNYYLQSKGMMEEEVRKLDFERKHSLRPAMLFGERNETRIAEKIAQVLVKISEPIMLGRFKRYKGIHGLEVARAMIYLANNDHKDFIVESEVIKELGS